MRKHVGERLGRKREGVKRQQGNQPRSVPPHSQEHPHVLLYLHCTLTPQLDLAGHWRQGEEKGGRGGGREEGRKGGEREGGVGCEEGGKDRGGKGGGREGGREGGRVGCKEEGGKDWGGERAGGRQGEKGGREGEKGGGRREEGWREGGGGRIGMKLDVFPVVAPFSPTPSRFCTEMAP